MIFVALCLFQSATPTQTWNENRFRQLAHDRSEDNWRDVVARRGYQGYTGVWQETLGGAGAMAFYPAGVSDRRYVFCYGEGDSGWLLYERKAGSKASIVWWFELKAKDKWPLRKHVGSNVKGTLNRYLAYNGWYAAHPSRLTRAERSTLKALRSFAVVAPSGRDPEHSPLGTFIHPDGKPAHGGGAPVEGFTITADEKTELLANQRPIRKHAPKPVATASSRFPAIAAG